MNLPSTGSNKCFVELTLSLYLQIVAAVIRIHPDIVISDKFNMLALFTCAYEKAAHVFSGCQVPQVEDFLQRVTIKSDLVADARVEFQSTIYFVISLLSLDNMKGE